ncbi:MAG: hypothetical protein ACO1OB_16645 [Archangium sp.]
MATSKKTKQNEFARADELVLAIGNAILEDDNIKNREWDSLALVIEIADGDRNMYGYVFDENGEAHAEMPEESNVVELAQQLREEMSKDDEPWRAMLFQVLGDELRLSFDHEGNEWAMGADNVEEIIEKIRPNFDPEADDDDSEDMTPNPPAAKKKPAPAKKKAPAKKAAAKAKKAPAKKVAPKKAKKPAPKKKSKSKR